MRYLIILLALTSCGLLSKNFEPVIPENPLVGEGEKICVIGDGGTGDRDQYEVANDLALEGCTRVLYVGDVVYEYGLATENDEAFFNKFYKPYKALLENQKVPFYMSMGNHDWYFMGTAEPWIKLDKMYEMINYPDLGYAFKFNGVCITQFEVYKTKFWNQMRDMYKQLKGTDFYKDCELNIGFSHYPYKSSGDHGDAIGSQKQFLEDMGVGEYDIYVAGHDHFLADEGYFKNSRLLISGSAGKLRKLKDKPKVWGKSARGYLIINFKKGSQTTFQFKSKKQVVHSGKI